MIGKQVAVWQFKNKQSDKQAVGAVTVSAQLTVLNSTARAYYSIAIRFELHLGRLCVQAGCVNMQQV